MFFLIVLVMSKLVSPFFVPPAPVNEMSKEERNTDQVSS